MKLSVVTPAHNEEGHLAACISSVSASARHAAIDVEHIVVLNRCNDRTEEIAVSLGCRIAREDARNLSRIRNAGVSVSTGEIIVTIDADSVMSRDMLGEVVRMLGTGRYVGGGVRIYPERWSLGIVCSLIVVLPFVVWHRVSAGMFWCFKSDFDSIGGFDESLVCIEDVDFGTRLKQHGHKRGLRYGTIRRAHITTSCRKFDQFGDWYFVRNPGVVWNIFRRRQHTADAFYYDARMTEQSGDRKPPITRILKSKLFGGGPDDVEAEFGTNQAIHRNQTSIELRTTLKAPEFNNSAGRLLCLLNMLLPSQQSYFDTIVQFYGLKADAPTETKGRAYLDFMALIGRAFNEFIVDLETSASIPELSRGIIKEGLSDLINGAYPASPNSAARRLQDAEVALLRMAASMIETEPALNESDVQNIRASIDELQQLLEASDLKASARAAILELMRLSRNAIDYYAIQGAEGFEAAFKKMLADLMEIYLHEGTEVTKENWWAKAVDHLRKIDAVASKLLK